MNKQQFTIVSKIHLMHDFFFLYLHKPWASVSNKFHLIHFLLMKYPWCKNNENNNDDDNNNDNFTNTVNLS